MRPHASAGFAVLLAVAPCAAGLIERDLFEPGDGLLTYDEATGREWLDFTIGRYLAESGITDSGDLPRVLDDFQIATLDDVEALMRSAATPRVDPWSFKGLTDSGVDLVDLMGETMRASGSILSDMVHAGGLVAPGSGVSSEHESVVAVAAYNFGVQLIPGALFNPAASRSSGYYALTDSDYPFDFDPDWRTSVMATPLVSELDRETNADLDTDPPIVVDDLKGNGTDYSFFFVDFNGNGVIDDDEIIGTFTDFGDLYDYDVSYSRFEAIPAYWLFREAAPVPEPAGIVLAAASGFALVRRRVAGR